MLYVYSPFVEDCISVLGQMLNENKKYFICIDSIGNLESKKLENDITTTGMKADQGLLQKSVKRMLKILLAIAKKQESIVVMAGHLYGSPSMYSPPENVGGGKHVLMAPHIVLMLKKQKIFSGEGKAKKVIGNEISVTSTKNRFCPAFQSCKVSIDYQNGVDPYSGIEEMGLEMGLLTKGGSWYTNTLNDKKCRGKDKLKDIIDQEFLEELDKYVLKQGYSGSELE